MPAGRPTDYRKEYNEQVEKLCKLGATDKELADFFEVSESTINLWKINEPGFSESIKNGKEKADSNVAERLYQRAMGYEHDDVHILTVSDGSGAGSHVEKVPIRKYYPPDSVAAIFWLKNRKPDKWREKVIQSFEGDLPPQRIEIISSYDVANKQKEKSDNGPSKD